MSEFTQKKARNLIDTGSIARIDDFTFQAKASTTGKSYIIRNGACECPGYRYRDDCSHVQAVQIMMRIDELGLLEKIKRKNA